MSGRLRDIIVKQLKPGTNVVKVSDGGGLQLWVTPAGGKHWKLAYRHDGKQKKLALGEYPVIGLTEARAAALEAKRKLFAGEDPGEEKRREKEEKRAEREDTFAKIATEVLEKKRLEGISAKTLRKVEWVYRLADPHFGERAIGLITAKDVLAVCRLAEVEGKRETAHRIRAVVGEVFRYAIATDRARYDPTPALKGALLKRKAGHFAAITDPADFGALLRAVDGFTGQATTVAALQLMALLFPRPGELRQARWSEFDLEAGLWVIPAARMKMRREHRVPLSRQAVEVLRQLHRVTGYGALVFPGFGRTGGEGKKIEPKPISDNTLNASLRRMGFDKDTMTAHGFRASARTMLAESGLFSREAMEKSLAHEENNKVVAAYARAQHWEERVRMLQWWADACDAMRAGSPTMKDLKVSGASGA